MAEENQFEHDESQEEGAESMPASQPEAKRPSDAPPEAAATPEPPPGIESTGLAAEPEPMEDAAAETELEKEPTRFQIFLRRALTWLGIGAVLFLAGFLTFYFTLHRPKVTALEETEAQLAQVEEELQAVQGRLDSANQTIDSLQTADEHRALLAVVVDVYAARLALTQEDTVAAKTKLSKTDETLGEVLDSIAEFDSGLAQALPQRLSLIITNIDRDIETAIEDCDQMIDDLLEVETALYE